MGASQLDALVNTQSVGTINATFQFPTASKQEDTFKILISTHDQYSNQHIFLFSVHCETEYTAFAGNGVEENTLHLHKTLGIS